ncbi:MAG: HD domain-containing protein [Cyanobacteria bacterium]|nr:HD domain-containing protein [Cyanobacteriota bacterium]
MPKAPRSKTTSSKDSAAKKPAQKSSDARFSSIEGLVELDRKDLEQKEDAEALYQLSLLLTFKKDYTQAIELLEKAQRIFTKNREFLGALWCMIELAWQRYNSPNDTDGVTKANRLFAEAQKMINSHINESGINEARARLLHYQGLARYLHGEFGQGIKLILDARSYCRPQGLEAAKILDTLGIHYEKTGDYRRAIDCLHQALNIKKQINIPWEIAITGQILGRLYLSQEDFVSASRFLSESLQLSTSLGDTKRTASIHNELIKLHIQKHEFDDALGMITEMEGAMSQNVSPVLLANALFYKAFIAYIHKDFTLCSQIAQKDVLPVFKKYRYRKGLGKVYRLMACLESIRGETRKAIETMGEALSLFKEIKEMDELAKTHFELGKIFHHLGEPKLALSSMLEALKVAEINGFRFLTSYIEDEIYRIDEAKWQEIVHKRANHERIFEKEHTLLDALSALSGEAQTRGDSRSTTKPSASAAVMSEDNRMRSMLSLLRVGQAMAGERDVDKLLYLIKEETERSLDADRCTVFMYDRDRNELWSKVASGLDKVTDEIRFPAHLGLAGYVCKTGEILNIKDAYSDPRFNKEVDKKTGYKTENLICIPMRNRKMEIMGVFQVLNKRNGHFEKADEDLLMAIAASAGVALENAQLTTDRKTAFESFIKTLSSTIDARDPITAGHSERVAEYSTLLGDEMKMDYDEVEALKYASLLHDIGKIGIREDILIKDGRLTQKEYRHIQKHAYYTYEILKNIHFEKHLRLIPEIAASHHEKMDGSGYFRGLDGKEIPISGRILAISDVFDAITSRRHYRNRMPFDKVLSVLHRDAGTHFDPDCVEAFFNVRVVNLAEVLIMEKHIELPEKRFTLLKEIDNQVSVREYGELLKKEKMSKAEADIHRAFSSIYHMGHLSDLD